MILKTKDFKKALETVRPALASKLFIEQVTSFTFTGGKVYAFNDALCVSHPIEGCELECVVPSELLLKYIGRVTAKELKVEQKEHELFIKAGRSRSGFPLENEIKLPLEEFMLDLEDAETQPLPSDFNEALKFASESCANDLESAKLSSVHLSEKGFIEATDKLRLSHWKLEHSLEGIESVLIPKNSVNPIVNIGATAFIWADEWIHFVADETILSCRVIHEKYMDTSRVLQKPETKGIKLTFHDDLVPALRRAGVFAERQNKADEILTVAVMKDKIKIKAEAESGSWHEEFVSIEHNKGKSFKFAITIDLLLSILSKGVSCKIYNDRILFTSNSWTYLSMLKQLPKEEK